MKWRRVIFALIIALVVAVLLRAGYGRKGFVDLTTYRTKSTSTVWGMTTRDTIRETAVSAALSDATRSAPSEWAVSSIDTGFGYLGIASEGSSARGALSSAEGVMLIVRMSDDQRRDFSEKLVLIQRDYGPHAVDVWCSFVWLSENEQGQLERVPSIEELLESHPEVRTYSP